MDVDFGMVCDFASLTPEGKLNVLGVFQEINAPTLPFTLPMMFVVVAFTAGAAERGMKKNAKLMLLDPDAQLILGLESGPMEVPASRPGAKGRVNAVIGLNNVTFQRYGPHSFEVLVDDDTKGSVPIWVVEPQIDQQGGEQHASE
jgi:hypothetical protein